MIADRLDWIELVTSHACNCHCEVCPSSNVEPRSLTAQGMAEALQLGRRRGATGAWFGGGEPTLHPALLPLVEHARSLGYRRIRIQTNGMRLAYEAYARELVRAGANEFALAVKGPDAVTHNAMARHPQAFALLERGAKQLATLGVRCEADVLMTRASIDRLAETVERFVDLGACAFTFWLMSLHGLDQAQMASLMPSMTEVVRPLQRALDRAAELRAQASTLHTPPCVLEPQYRRNYQHAGTWRLLVVVPEGQPFMAEDSPIEGGVYLEGCASCAARPDCLGLRADYLAARGEHEFVPIPRA